MIQNRTDLLILQHIRERFHPFNTARILRRALVNSRMIVDHIDGLAATLEATSFSSEVGLLYPGKDSILLEELCEEERPKQLVVLDGTWHHTKTLVRDIPLLRSLRCYRLAPAEPSRYGFRREPDRAFLSTLEATVAALRCLEPETVGLERLDAAFDSMVATQLAHPKSKYVLRTNRRRGKSLLSVPSLLRDRFANVVVVYGETAPGVQGVRNSKCETYPIYWVAERMVSGERMEQAVVPPSALPTSCLGHLELEASVFDHGCSLMALSEAWKAFLRPTDEIVFYHSNVPRILEVIGGKAQLGLNLKSIKLGPTNKKSMKTHRTESLDQKLDRLNVAPSPIHFAGRAGKRLANVIALANYIRSGRSNP